MLDVVVILLFSLGIIFTNSSFVKSYANASRLKKELNGLFIYHCLFVGFFTFYILKYGGDSWAYWNYQMQQVHVTSDNMFNYYGISTTFLLFLNYIPSKIFGLSYFTGNFLYGCLGFIGFRYLYVLFRESLLVNVKLFGFRVIPFLFYLPNLHFWSAGIGKDTLCFFGIAWFFYGLYDYRKRFITILLALLLVYHVRPHMAVLMMSGAGVAIVMTDKVKPVFKVLFIITVLLGFYMVYDKILAFLKIEDLSVASLEDLANNRVGVLNRAKVGSGIDLASYSIPARFFTYLYRPLFFDAGNIASIFSSLENAIYLVISFLGVKSFKIKYLKEMPVWMKAGWVVFLMSVVIFANSLSNLGIIMRMKNMTMIYMLITAAWFMNKKRFADLQQKRIAMEKKATKSKQRMVRF